MFKSIQPFLLVIVIALVIGIALSLIMPGEVRVYHKVMIEPGVFGSEPVYLLGVYQGETIKLVPVSPNVYRDAVVGGTIRAWRLAW